MLAGAGFYPRPRCVGLGMGEMDSLLQPECFGSGFLKGERLDKGILEIKPGGKFHMFDQIGQCESPGTFGPREQGHPGSPSCGIAHRRDLLQGNPRQQPYSPGAFLADIVSKGAGQQDLIKIVFCQPSLF